MIVYAWGQTPQHMQLKTHIQSNSVGAQAVFLLSGPKGGPESVHGLQGLILHFCSFLVDGGDLYQARNPG